MNETGDEEVVAVAVRMKMETTIRSCRVWGPDPPTVTVLVLRKVGVSNKHRALRSPIFSGRVQGVFRVVMSRRLHSPLVYRNVVL